LKSSELSPLRRKLLRNKLIRNFLLRPLRSKN
jgi:hypothetical protein